MTQGYETEIRRNRISNLVEEEPFTRQAKKLGGAGNIDHALNPIIEALATRPEGFPTIPGWAPIRLAKMEPILYKDDVIPAIRVWFRIDGETVYLLYLEEILDSD